MKAVVVFNFEYGTLNRTLHSTRKQNVIEVSSKCVFVVILSLIKVNVSFSFQKNHLIHLKCFDLCCRGNSTL